ncbi:MAG: tRNA (adenosine(37)-N6)-threonylcarbamoyltransferase complex transferase subunit TsaD [Thermodesulfobacteriota bacterium]
MLVLAIESSCDETAAAVTAEGGKALSNIVSSQTQIHRKYGGIVPELASRKHIEAIIPVIKQALLKAGITLDHVEGIAVTNGPGLIGSLLVGLSVAKAIAYARNVPFIGVNHVEGHLSAIFLENPRLQFPFIGLVVSGGHTCLYRVKHLGSYEWLGGTRDDAAGEAFDKVAKLLNLGYPGGPVIDKAATDGDPQAISFPRAFISRDTFDFSFSGIKTSVLQYVKKHPHARVEDIAASFQEAVVDVLISKAVQAARAFDLPRIVLSGGVASNRRLRIRLKEIAEEEGVEVNIPSPILCTDNAAMIGVIGHYYLERGKTSPMTLNAFSSLPI